jgi:hypothetical protein
MWEDADASWTTIVFWFRAARLASSNSACCMSSLSSRENSWRVKPRNHFTAAAAIGYSIWSPVAPELLALARHYGPRAIGPSLLLIYILQVLPCLSARGMQQHHACNAPKTEEVAKSLEEFVAAMERRHGAEIWVRWAANSASSPGGESMHKLSIKFR